MVRGLVAPLSPREIGHLRDLQRDGPQLGPIGLERFITLGLVEERPDGFAIAEVGWLRLHAELIADAVGRERAMRQAAGTGTDQ